MPVYEYQCAACGKQFEYQQRMADAAKTECEACGGALERLISRTAFHLKGGGWYKDLYASTKPEGGGEGGGASTPASSGDTGSATPAAAPAAPATPAAATPAQASTPSPSSGGGCGGGGTSSGSGAA